MRSFHHIMGYDQATHIDRNQDIRELGRVSRGIRMTIQVDEGDLVKDD